MTPPTNDYPQPGAATPIPSTGLQLHLGSGPNVEPGWVNVDKSWVARVSRIRPVIQALAALGVLNDQAFYALTSRLIPYRVSTTLQERLLGQAPESKFPTRYDSCTDRSLRKLLQQGGWSSWDIVPYYKAGGYLNFSRKLRSAYLVYENWAERGAHTNLATHYLVEAAA